MPTLHNPTEYTLPCYRINRVLDADESVEITDEEAADLEDGAVFRVERGSPKRETVKRGGKRAEVTKAPERETRGLTTGNAFKAPGS